MVYAKICVDSLFYRILFHNQLNSATVIAYAVLRVVKFILHSYNYMFSCNSRLSKVSFVIFFIFFYYYLVWWNNISAQLRKTVCFFEPINAQNQENTRVYIRHHVGVNWLLSSIGFARDDSPLRPSASFWLLDAILRGPIASLPRRKNSFFQTSWHFTRNQRRAFNTASCHVTFSDVSTSQPGSTTFYLIKWDISSQAVVRALLQNNTILYMILIALWVTVQSERKF